MSRGPDVRYLRKELPAFCIEGGGTHSRGALYMPGSDSPTTMVKSGMCNPSNDFSEALASADYIWERISAETSMGRNEVVTILGVAGLNPDGLRARFVDALEGFDEVVPLSDGYASLIGSGGGRPCGMIVAGTGCAGHRLRPDGISFQRDGWGWIGGDRGSGAWIGHKAIRHALLVRDGLGKQDRLSELVINELGDTDSRITGWLGNSTPRDIAALAKLVFLCAEEGLGRANDLLDAAAAHLRDLLMSLECTPGEPLFLSGTIAEALVDRIAKGMETKPSSSTGKALEGCRLVASGKAPIEWPGKQAA